MKEAMTRLFRWATVVALVSLGALLLTRYSAEWQLARAEQLVDQALRGRVAPSAIAPAMTEAVALLEHSARALQQDARRLLAQATALTILGRGREAIELIAPEIARAERPELLVALGRAHASTGNDTAARAAFLRAAWIAPASLSTLPKRLRDELLVRTAEIESELARVPNTAPPPLP